MRSVRLTAVLLLCACQPQARRLLVLDLALSEPALLNGTVQPWRDEGYNVEYRRFYPHLARADLDRIGVWRMRSTKIAPDFLSNSYFTGSPPTGTSMITLTRAGGSSPSGIRSMFMMGRPLTVRPELVEGLSFF